jgi:hypothetical protein
MGAAIAFCSDPVASVLSKLPQYKEKIEYTGELDFNQLSEEEINAIV